MGGWQKILNIIFFLPPIAKHMYQVYQAEISKKVEFWTFSSLQT